MFTRGRRALLIALGAIVAITGAALALPGRTHHDAATVPSATVVTVGDIACPPLALPTATHCRQAATAKLATALDPDRVLVLGDLQYEAGAYTAFQQSYDRSWGALRALTWPVVGNHEYKTAGAAGYYRYFAGSTRAPGYYRRTINGWDVYVLNSNCDRIDCRTERLWLRDSLAAHPTRCALMAMHHPRFSSGKEHGSSAAMKPFWDVAQRYGVDLALAGHDHDYERFRVQDSAAHASATGLQSFVVGTGGRSLYAKGSPAPGSQLFLAEFGVLKLVLRPRGWSWQFIDLDRKVRDSGSSVCH